MKARKNNELLKSITRYLPADFEFRDYSRVWKYHSSPEYAKVFTVDIFARSLDIAKRKGLPAAKMKGGWIPGS